MLRCGARLGLWVGRLKDETMSGQREKARGLYVGEMEGLWTTLIGISCWFLNKAGCQIAQHPSERFDFKNEDIGLDLKNTCQSHWKTIEERWIPEFRAIHRKAPPAPLFLSFVTGGTRHSCSGDHYVIKESCSFSEGCYPFSPYLITAL